MSDDKKSLINLVPDSIDNATKNITDAPTKSMGQTMADLWFLIFGGITQAADKKRAKYNIELNKFKEELTAALKKVPEENRKEPSSHVVLSALNESKYCIEEEELRKLFVELISSATNSTKLVHPSFANIIRQMNPCDALLLSEIKHWNHLHVLDNAERYNNFVICKELLSYIIMTDCFKSLSIEQLSLSISSLMRLGLIELTYPVLRSNDFSINPLHERQLIQKIASDLRTGKLNPGEGFLLPTTLGMQFIDCCLP